MFNNLREMGWANIDGVKSHSDLIALARMLGTPVRQRNGEIIKLLRPTDTELARFGTLSASYGRDAFPLHTDTAFWPTPVRYLVFWVTGDRRRVTTLVSWRQVLDRICGRARAELERSLWYTGIAPGKFLSSFRFKAGNVDGYRFDLLSMMPANRSAQVSLDILEDAINSSTTSTFGWQADSALIIDNWLMLHGRGPAPHKEQDRLLSRIYVR